MSYGPINDRGLLSGTGLPAPGNGLSFLNLVECSLHDHRTLSKLRRKLTSKRSKTESRPADAYQFQKLVSAAAEDLDMLRVGHGQVEELVAERASLSLSTKQAKAERPTFNIQVLQTGCCCRDTLQRPGSSVEGCAVVEQY